MQDGTHPSPQPMFECQVEEGHWRHFSGGGVNDTEPSGKSGMGGPVRNIK
jgi:hypothetical protein